MKVKLLLPHLAKTDCITLDIRSGSLTMDIYHVFRSYLHIYIQKKFIIINELRSYVTPHDFIIFVHVPLEMRNKNKTKQKRKMVQKISLPKIFKEYVRFKVKQ